MPVQGLPLLISIHAPAKGATLNQFRIVITDFISIHAPAKGATNQHLHRQWILEFQSTHPRRVRRCVTSLGVLSSYFNPRTREGCDDVKELKILITKGISIHAPAKGATMSLPTVTRPPFISIHAPAKGATLFS